MWTIFWNHGPELFEKFNIVEKTGEVENCFWIGGYNETERANLIQETWLILDEGGKL